MLVIERYASDASGGWRNATSGIKTFEESHRKLSLYIFSLDLIHSLSQPLTF